MKKPVGKEKYPNCFAKKAPFRCMKWHPEGVFLMSLLQSE